MIILNNRKNLNRNFNRYSETLFVANSVNEAKKFIDKLISDYRFKESKYSYTPTKYVLTFNNIRKYCFERELIFDSRSTRNSIYLCDALY